MDMVDQQMVAVKAIWELARHAYSVYSIACNE